MQILAQNSQEKDTLKNLVSKQTPNYRQAYSDRTAFIMACLSELVYLRFEEPFFSQDDTKIMERLDALLSEEKLAAFKKLYDIFGYDNKEELKKLESELQLLNIQFLAPFDSNGTQAMIVSTKNFYVLAFRGTEVTSVKDIKTDLDAVIVSCESGGKIHRGFKNGFAEVHMEIQDYLNNNLDEAKPLFITGHSLGGALATVATKKLTYEHGIAACYTFGSPRVGNEEWMDGIKTPIYRVVNSADPVTMLPPGNDMVLFASWILKLFRLKVLAKSLINRYGEYYHAGDMRFLTNVEDGDYSSAKLLYSVTFLRRIRAYVNKVRGISSLPSDHNMDVYRKKLKHIAIDKNTKET